jgi:hypothetical protein
MVKCARRLNQRWMACGAQLTPNGQPRSGRHPLRSVPSMPFIIIFEDEPHRVSLFDRTELIAAQENAARSLHERRVAQRYDVTSRTVSDRRAEYLRVLSASGRAVHSEPMVSVSP